MLANLPLFASSNARSKAVLFVFMANHTTQSQLTQKTLPSRLEGGKLACHLIRAHFMITQQELYQRFASMLSTATDELRSSPSDRASVLLGAAFVDQCVTTTIINFLAPCEATDMLLDPQRPGALSTFAAKVRLCVSLGLMPEVEAKHCLDLAKARNDFAHQIGAALSNSHLSAIERAEKFLQLTIPKTLKPAGRYHGVCSGIALRIALRWTDEHLSKRRILHDGSMFPAD